MKSMLCLLLTIIYVDASAETIRTWNDPITTMPFVFIDGACYQMGSDTPVSPEPGRIWNNINYNGSLSDDESPEHRVCLPSFWIGQFEVTVSDWNKVMTSDEQAATGSLPVSNISWTQANEFAAKLSTLSGLKYRLPTEAEWEYVCRAGFQEIRVVHSNGLVGEAWYNRDEARRTAPQPVGKLTPNPFGLHDMLGNVWEWTLDSYQTDGYHQHAENQPLIRSQKGQKVMRGGSFRTEPRQTRCTVRGHLKPEQRLISVGLRLVREIQD